MPPITQSNELVLTASCTAACRPTVARYTAPPTSTRNSASVSAPSLRRPAAKKPVPGTTAPRTVRPRAAPKLRAVRRDRLGGGRAPPDPGAGGGGGYAL